MIWDLASGTTILTRPIKNSRWLWHCYGMAE
jgi:hypothetical protein